ncbi:MAG: TIR domain-containing protein, partial [Candidatus Kapaibacterium sp.]
MDTASLAGAETWSGEIVQAIKDCMAFVLLLSPDSVASVNVTKEVGLASEKRKLIIPIQIAECQMSNAMEYALAGLHIVSMSDDEALSRTFAKIGATPGSKIVETRGSALLHKNKRSLRIIIPIVLLAFAAGAYFIFSAKKPQSVSESQFKTLAVLPFESLSPDKENEYFANGMTATLIDMLAPIPILRVVDRKSAMEFAGEKKDIKSIASALNVQYIVEGTVQRDAGSIKVSVQLIDGQTGSVLKTQDFSGTTTDLMAFQEQIARSVVYYIQPAFTPNGAMMPPGSWSSNPEAYNLCMLAAPMGTSDSEITTSIEYFSRAVKLDPNFAWPYLQ